MSKRCPHILVLTTSRADFFIYNSVLSALKNDPDVDFGLAVTGQHLDPRFGMSVNAVRKSGFPIDIEFPCLDPRDTPEGIGTGMGEATKEMAKALSQVKTDMVMVLGDRYEMAGAALASVPFNIPVIHLHGGEETTGAVDNLFRHVLTKISHVHCCATELSAQRIRQMGEDPDHVHVTGAPALDSIVNAKITDRDVFLVEQNLPFKDAFALITYHPVTNLPDAADTELSAIFEFLDETGLNGVFTGVNADAGNSALEKQISEFAKDRRNIVTKTGFGPDYYSAMAHAEIMIGNSSSGIIEAASLALPVINIGERQAGRERSANTLDCTGDAGSLMRAYKRVTSSEFQAICDARQNVYGDGRGASRIVKAAKAYLASAADSRKPFHMLNGGAV